MYTEETDRGALGRWKDGDMVRFYQGLPQKIGGWTKYYDKDALAMTYLGECRAVHDWVALDGTKYSAFGTDLKLYLIKSTGELFDITPVRATSTDLANCFSTDTGGAYDPTDEGAGTDASFVLVTDVAHGATVGDFVTIDQAAAVGGVTPDGEYQIVEPDAADPNYSDYFDEDNYVIQLDTAATSTVALGGGANTDLEYQINTGEASNSGQYGFGTLDYGEESWGTPREVTELADAVFRRARIWALNNWGEDLIASYNGGAVYLWDKSAGEAVRATAIGGDSPITNQWTLVSTESRQLLCFGAHDGTNEDRLLVRWSDYENYSDFTPTVENAAGSKRLDSGSEILGAVKTREGYAILTDLSLHIMSFSGGADIFSIDFMGEVLRPASPRSMVDAKGLLVWMGTDNFYMYDGVVNILPCDVRTKVFGSFNAGQSDLVYCSVNKIFSEVWWFYPDANSETNNSYVVWNYADNVWTYGKMARTAFHDKSDFFKLPYAFEGGFIYQHESGSDADGVAIVGYLESWDIDIKEGGEKVSVKSMIPDFKELNSQMSLTLKPKIYPTKSLPDKGAYYFDGTTDKIDVRVSGRQVAFRLDFSALGGFFRMGTWRAEVKPDGSR